MTANSAAALTWAQRAQAELGAKAVFQKLIISLNEVGASRAILKMVETACEDEGRHAILCSEVAVSLGHKSGFAMPGLQTVSKEKSWEKNHSFRDQVLCDMVLMGCVTETINASLLNSIYSNAPKTELLSIVHQILKDEIKHSQMGWTHLAHEAKSRDCSFLSDHLVSMFEISVKDELFAPATNTVGANFPSGVMPEEFRLEQFRRTFQEVVIPGFNHFGISTTAAESWLNSKKS